MGNPTDAEDALSRAMLKAWEKVRDCTDDIKNFKAWLTKLTYNLCADIHREHNRSAVGVDSLDTIAIGNETELISQEETPVRAAMQRELELFFRAAIDELPDRLRETFLLHFESGLSYPDIAEQLGISYDNVRKRISQARAILRQRFNENFGEDGTDSDLSNPNSRVSPQSAKQRKSKKTAQKEPVAGEIILSGELEEVQIVAGVELPEAALSVRQIDHILVDAKSHRKLEEIEIVADGEPQPAALSVPHREKLELEKRMMGEKPRFFSCSNEMSAFPWSSQWAIPLRRLTSLCTLKQLLIGVSLAWSSENSASPLPETGFLRLLTRGARSVNKGINSS